MSKPKPYIGGQAVIEGVMMRAPSCVTVAVRRPDGAIAVHEEPMRSKVLASPISKIPGLRGIAMLVESMTLGYRALRFSADQQLVGPSVATLMLAFLLADGDAPAGKTKSESSGSNFAFTLSLLIAVGLFVALPQAAAATVIHYTGWHLTVQDFGFHALTGGFKLLILTCYLAFLSSMRDVRRVFQYHGAEHKTIYAYERGLKLTVANVRKQSTLHPRCGTTLLITVVLVSIVLGAIVSPLVLPNAQGLEANIMAFGLRLVLLIPIAAVSYELQRLGARFCTTGPLRVLLWPGFLFQKITTRQPDDSQIEIAIAAMESAIHTRGEEADSGEVRVFESFESFREAQA